MHNHKLEHANVVAVFDSQDAAEEAILGLRVAGFPDARVGYFARNLTGLVTDFVWEGYTALGAVLGLVAGALLGGRLAIFAQDINATPFAPPLVPGDTGVMITGAVCGAVLLGIVGAMVGWGVPRRDAVHFGNEMSAGRYVVSVEAGGRTDEAWAAIRQHGGHAPLPADAVTHVGPVPA